MNNVQVLYLKIISTIIGIFSHIIKWGPFLIQSGINDKAQNSLVGA
jgi:hypothetical protein